MLDSLKTFLKAKEQQKRLYKQFQEIQKWQREMYNFKSRQEQEIHLSKPLREEVSSSLKII